MSRTKNIDQQTGRQFSEGGWQYKSKTKEDVVVVYTLKRTNFTLNIFYYLNDQFDEARTSDRSNERTNERSNKAKQMFDITQPGTLDRFVFDWRTILMMMMATKL